MAQKTKKMGRPKLGKMTIAIRIQPTTNDKLDRAVAAVNAAAPVEENKMDKSTYIENLLLAKFKREGIT
jgi:hypothetical protein